MPSRPMGPEVSGRGLEGSFNLFGDHGAEFAAGYQEELGLVEGVIAAEEHDDRARLAQLLGVVGFGGARRCRPSFSSDVAVAC